jgi:DNA-binding response OmpR family regulator
MDELIDAVWDDDAPKTAWITIRAHVGVIRSRLGAHRIKTASTQGYQWVEGHANTETRRQPR